MRLTKRKYPLHFWEIQFSKLASWAATKNYKVECLSDAEDQLDFYTRTISINSRQHAENRFYSLAHECGHLLISGSAEQFQKDHPVYAFSGKPGLRQKTRAYQVSLIAEEIEAWKRGRRLVKRMRMYIDDEKFDKLMSGCVMSYVLSAAKMKI